MKIIVTGGRVDENNPIEETIVEVGFSRTWNSKEAGRNVAQDLLEKLSETQPDLVLLFSTIHYKDTGGFQHLLEGVYEILPRTIPVIGGTIAGFIIPQGCFTRGVAAYGIKSNRLDFAVAMAENIKRHPEESAKKCAARIKSVLSKTTYKNKLLLNLPSGTTSPKIPGLPDNLRVFRTKGIFNIVEKLLIISIKFSLLFLQKGPGREEGIIETLAQELSDYRMIGGSFIDDNKGYFNFQFFNGKVYTNALITVAIATDYELSVQSNFGLVERGEKFNVTKSSVYDLVIEKINGKSAFDQILKILRWPASFIDDSGRILRRTFYTPIGYVVDGKMYVSVIAFIFGDSVMAIPKVRCEEACFLMTSGKKLIQAVDLNLAETKNRDIKFGFITSCIARLETLGSSSYKVHEKLLKHFGDKAFIEIYVVGEDVYTPELGAKRIAESYNTAIFYD